VLLIGVDGTGRTTMSKCSAFLMGQTFFEIQINKHYKEINWKDDLKKVIKQAGAK
jgi:dynein heavy chain